MYSHPQATIVRLNRSARRAININQSIANPNKALWEKGDFTEIAAFMRQSGEARIESMTISSTLDVLDLGCGDGTTAIPLAKTGANVTGIDIARNLVEAGNKRASAEGLTRRRFQEGDASNLQEVENDSFDLALSIFGAIFAPRPFDVAREMVRVTRPGGRIVMGNCIPNDPTFVSQLLKISSEFTPAPPDGWQTLCSRRSEVILMPRITAVRTNSTASFLSYLTSRIRREYRNSHSSFFHACDHSTLVEGVFEVSISAAHLIDTLLSRGDYGGQASRLQG
jgi:ubiquinone/menaquinone biosynthesis C-methylase UbiE